MNHFFYTGIDVFGFHGCNKEIKNSILSGRIEFKQSNNKWDWLGDGIYFWENDLLRAQRWAKLNHKEDGAVIGAKIRLGSCFDISNSFSKESLRIAYEDFKFHCDLANIKLPENKNPRAYSGNTNDLVLRYLDRAVIQHLFSMQRDIEPEIQYDTIRAPFQEGFQLFPGSAFREHDHIQVCVKNKLAILEIFDPGTE